MTFPRQWLPALGLLLLSLGAAQAQGVQCRTAPVGTSSGYCASEAFVTDSVPLPGQQPGTATNDNAAPGNVGEYLIASTSETGASQNSATVTITIASPAVVTWPAIPYSPLGNAVVNFTTTGALPTGLVVGTNYYVCGRTISGNSASLATSIANCEAATYIATTGTQSGVQSAVPTAILVSGTPSDVGGFVLTPGDWDVTSSIAFFFGASTSFTTVVASTSTASGSMAGQNAPGQRFQFSVAAMVPGVTNQYFSTGARRFSVAAASILPIFCVADATFTVSTMQAWGGCRARRVR